MNYDFDFAPLAPYWRSFCWGTLMTVALAVGTIVCGSLLGILLGVAWCSRFRPLTLLLGVVLDLVRALPPLVIILWFYYLLPIASGFRDMPSWMTAWAALTLNMAAFIADVVRAAVFRVQEPAIDAAKALGMTRRQIWMRVLIPEVLRQTLPTFSLMSIAALRNTSLASVVAVYELMHTANLAATNTLRAIEAYIVVAVIYVCLVMPFTLVSRRIERRFGAAVIRL